MKPFTTPAIVLIAALSVTTLLTNCDSSPAGHAENYDASSFPIALDNGMEIQSPFQFKNLEVYLITGSASNKEDYAILSEAMNKEMVEVSETGTVSELQISSNSQRTVYINAGDIVKGGKQDRTLAYDLIVEGMSEPQPVASFCVESGRWQQRGDEEVGKFSGNYRGLASRNLKIAAQKEMDQGKVWAEVSNTTYALNSTLKDEVSEDIDITANASSSSLDLALSSEELEEFKKEYQTFYQDMLDKHPNAVGLAYAINGEVFAIDIYNNQKLFADLWPKLIDATIVEAIAEFQGDTVQVTYADPNELMALYNADYSKEEVKELNDRTRNIATETNDCFRFETIDKGQEDKWTHISFIKADPEMAINDRSGRGNFFETSEQVNVNDYVEDLELPADDYVNDEAVEEEK